jgi:hypothetical protein
MTHTAEKLNHTVLATKQVERSVERLREIKRAAKALVAEAKLEEDIIKKYIGKNFDTLYDTKGSKMLATYKVVESEFFNKELFAEDHPDLLFEYTGVRSSRRLLIK